MIEPRDDRVIGGAVLIHGLAAFERLEIAVHVQLQMAGQVASDEIVRIGEAVRAARARGVQQNPRRFDGAARKDHETAHAPRHHAW